MSSKFPDNIIVAARHAHKAYGIFASVTLAQWAVESGFGEHMPPNSNNPFGIKARPGDRSVLVMTSEYYHGRYVRLPQHFCCFSSIYDAFDAHAALLAFRAAYHAARDAHDPRTFAERLTGVYATDPHYGATLISMMNNYDLYQYDK